MNTRIYPAALHLTLAAASTARADTHTWAGAGGSFTDPASWNGAAPALGGSATDQLLFPVPAPVPDPNIPGNTIAGTYTATIDVNSGPWTVNQLNITAGSQSNGPASPSIVIASTSPSGLAFAGNAPGVSLAGQGGVSLTLPAISIAGTTTFSTGASSNLYATVTGPITSTGSASLILAMKGEFLYQSTTAPTFSGGTVLGSKAGPDNSRTLYWDFHQPLAAAATVSFGAGAVMLNTGFLVFSASADTGTEGQPVVFNTPVVVQGSGYNAIFLARGGPVSPDVTFAGSISLAGQLWIGNASWETRPTPVLASSPGPMHYTGTITVDQSSSGVRSIYAFPTAGLGDPSLGSMASIPPVELSGNIIDDPDPTHTAKNPLTLGAWGPLVISGTNTYSTGTIINWALPGVTVAPQSSLGAGDVDIQFGTLALTAPTNIAAGRKLTVEDGGVLAIGFDDDVSGMIAPASTGTLALETVYTHAINLATLGTGSMSLGSTTGGAYTAGTLGVGSGNVYRLGERDGTLTLSQGVLIDSEVTPNRVEMMNIVLDSPNTYSGGTLVSGTCTGNATGALGSGDVTITGANYAEGDVLDAVNGVAGALNLAVPRAYAGNVFVYGTLAFTGANGVLTKDAPMPVLEAGSTLQLGDGVSVNNDRFPDSLDLALDTDTLAVEGAGTTSETMGAISYSGLSAIVLSPGKNAGDFTALVVPSLTRVGHGLLMVSLPEVAAGSGGPQTTQLFVTAPPAQTNGMLPPFIEIAQKDASTGNDTAAFVSYGPSGIVPATSVGMPDAGTGTEIVDLNFSRDQYGDPGGIMLKNSVSIWALRTNGYINVDSSAASVPTIRIGSGGLIESSDFGLGIVPNVDFGGAEAVISAYSRVGFNALQFYGIVTALHGVTVSGGADVRFENPASLVAGPVTVHSGYFETAALSDPNGSDPITLYGGAVFGVLGSMTIGRPIELRYGAATSSAVSLDGGALIACPTGESLTLTGGITGVVPLTIGAVNENAGTVRITGDVSLSGHSGSTGLANSSTLWLDGTASVSSIARNFGSLGGVGSLHAGEGFDNYGVIAPGDAAGVGTLTIALDSGELHFLIGGIPGPTGLLIDVDGSGHSDRLLVDGAVEIDPGQPLAFNSWATPLDQTYEILSANSIIGTFSSVTGLPDGFAVEYTPTSVLLVPTGVPEPASLCILVLPLVFLRRQSGRLSLSRRSGQRNEILCSKNSSRALG